jgi:iron complex outermembrane receptor protein
MVMSVFKNSKAALCHEDIEKQLPIKIDRVTIYRILQSFCNDGKVHKISSDNGKTYYALCHDCSEGDHHDNHLHFHCIKCETVSCIEESVFIPTLPAEYSVSSIACTVSGFCPTCRSVLKTLCLIVFLFTTSWSIFAQSRLTVLDKTTQKPVAFANVYYPDTKTGTHTDADGKFSVSSSMRSLFVQISSLGYKTFLGTLSPQDTPVIYMEPSVHELQEIVVSDNSSRLQGENVMNVEKLNLSNTAIQGISLSEKLSSVPGIDNFSTGAGIGKPVIRGLSGNRVAVFSQGIRVENQQWGDEHGLGLEENGYEQVEIIKGPASLLYGSDALGGVLYFTDERYAKDNMIESALGSEYNTNTNGWRNTGAFKFSKERFHWNLFGGYITHEDYRDGNTDFVPNSRFHTGDFKTSVSYTGDRFVSSLKYNFLNEKYGLTEDEQENEYSKSRQPELPYQDLTSHLISSENTVFLPNESKLKVDIGYVFNNRKEFEDGDAPALDMNLGTISYNAKWYSPKIHERWTWIAGSQGMYQSNTNRGEEVLIPDATTTDIGAFVLSDYYYSEKAYWQVGLRMDGRQITGKEHGAADEDEFIPSFSKAYFAFNFSTGIFHPVSEEWSFRTNLSSGYRSPNMFELLSKGVHEGTNRYEIGNTQLKTENGYQVDASINYKSKHLELFVSPYFNYVRNFIYLQPSDEIIDETPVYHYTQTDAFLYGGEAGFHFHPHPLDWLHLESSYSNTIGTDRLRDDLPLMPSQKLNVTVSASFSGKKAIKKFSVFVQNQYSLAQNRISNQETPTAAYNLFNTGVAAELGSDKQKLLLNIMANNLFNETYYDHLSRYKADGIYNIGRNLTVKLTIPFQWKIGYYCK